MERLTCNFTVNETVSLGWDYVIQTAGELQITLGCGTIFLSQKSNGQWKKENKIYLIVQISRCNKYSKMACENNKKVLLISSYMPKELANRSSFWHI